MYGEFRIDCIFSEIPSLAPDYPIAFEVPFHDLETAGKKPLPQKLQRLQEQQSPEPEETMKTLQKRLAEAEQRRQKVISSVSRSFRVTREQRSIQLIKC